MMKAATLLLTAALATNAMALYVNGYDSSKNERFLPGSFPTAPVKNLQSIASSYDLSSIGWVSANPAQTVTLISPIHFACATHWMPTVGTQITFHTTAGTLVNYKVTGYATFTKSDLAIGKLAPVSDVAVTAVSSKNAALLASNLMPQPAALPAARSKTAKPVLVVGQKMRLGSNTFEYRSGYLGSMDCDWEITGETVGEMYDSGSPSFGIVNGRVVLFGTASTVQGAITNYAAVLPMIADIKAVVAKDGFSICEVLVK
jgi:hypothetical protein